MLGCVGIAYFHIAKERKQEAILNDMINLLKQLQLLIEAQNLTIVEGLMRVKSSYQDEVAGFITEMLNYHEGKAGGDVGILWNELLVRMLPVSLIGKNAQRILKNLGDSLGGYSKKIQISTLYANRQLLEEERELIRQHRLHTQKLVTTMGVLAGILLIVLLI